MKRLLFLPFLIGLALAQSPTPGSRTVLNNPKVQTDIDMEHHQLLNFDSSNIPSLVGLLSTQTLVVQGAPNGNDATGIRGRLDKPFATLQAAHDHASVGDEIDVQSDLTGAGILLTTNRQLVIDFHGHKITASSQTDTQKIAIGADGTVIKNLEVNGTWDHSSSGATTGPAITHGNKRVTLENIYAHDIQDSFYIVNGDFSDCTTRYIKYSWIKGQGIYFNSQNAAIHGHEDFGFISYDHIGNKGLAVARGGAESNTVYGVSVHQIYYDTTGTVNANDEAIYMHGLTDFNLSGVIGVGSKFNVSLDNDSHGSISHLDTRGGLGAGQYCGLELAAPHDINVSDSVFDGISRAGATSTAGGGIELSNINGVGIGGPVNFSNVTSVNWPTALQAQELSGITINGGLYSGTFGLSFTLCDSVSVTGAHIYATGNSGAEAPIIVDSGAGGSSPDTSGSNFSFIGNFLSAVTGCTAEIKILSQDVHHPISQVTVRDNTRIDSATLGGFAVDSTIGSGGSVTKLTVIGNVPSAGWNNDIDPVLSLANTFTDTQTIQSSPSNNGSLFWNLVLNSTTAYNDGPESGITLRVKYNVAGDYSNAGGITVTKNNNTDGDYSSYVSLHARVNGQNPVEVLRADPTNNSFTSHLPIHIDHFTDTSAPNDSIYYSTTQSKLVYKDGGGVVNNLY